MISTLEKEITFRYLKTRKKDGFLNIISIFSFIGISLGVAVLIIVMSVMNGFRTELINKIVGFNAHVTVKPYDKPINIEKLNNNTLKLISNDLIFSNIGEAIVINKDYTKGIVLRGYNNQDFSKLDIVKKGNFIGDSKNLIKNYISVGKELSFDLNLEVGDKIGNLSTSMSTTGDEFNSQLSAATNNMVQAIEDINSKISQQGEVFEGIAKSTMGAVESIERSTATFTEITEPLKEITSKIETALIQMGQTTDKLSTLQEGMEKVVDSINSSTNTMQDTWNDYQTRFKDIDESFSNSLEKFGTAMNVNQQNAQDFIRDIETQFKSSLQTLSSAISNFEDSIEELQITFNKQISQNQTEQTTDNQ